MILKVEFRDLRLLVFTENTNKTGLLLHSTTLVDNEFAVGDVTH